MKCLNVMTSVSLFLIPLIFLADECLADQQSDHLNPYGHAFHLSLHKNELYFPSLYFRDQEQKSTDPSAELIPKKRLGRAVLELAAVFAYSQTKYWLTYEEWLEDWSYELTWEDQKKRFFSLEAWKFDSNCFNLNWSHALAGALYYDIARSNNLNRLESLLFTIGGSFYWEYIVEWRNVISIGDNIFTIVGGTSIGEAWYQLGKYLADRTELGYRILSFINPVVKLNRWFDRNASGKWPRQPEPGWHKFDFFLGSRFDRRTTGDHYQGNYYGGGRTQMIHIPDFGDPGKISRKETGTIFTGLFFDLAAGTTGIEEANISAQTVFFGHFRQNIDQNEEGYAYYIGLGSAFSYFKKRGVAFYDGCEVKVKRGYDLQLEKPRDFRDKFSAVHLAGPVFDLTSFSSKFRLRLVLDAYLDFALVNAFALNKYSEGRDISGIKTTLLHYGYYYGIGATFGSDINITYDNLELNGVLRYHTWGSIEGRDRFQVEVTDDFHITDSRLQVKLSLGYWIPQMPIALFGSFEGIGREGNIKDTRHKETENRLFLGLNFKF